MLTVFLLLFLFVCCCFPFSFHLMLSSLDFTLVLAVVVVFVFALKFFQFPIFFSLPLSIRAEPAHSWVVLSLFECTMCLCSFFLFIVIKMEIEHNDMQSRFIHFIFIPMFVFLVAVSVVFASSFLF